MTNPQEHLARTLKEIRQARGWSLDRSAEITGVSKAMLGQIERGESSPTIATLWKIATGFEVSISCFLESAPKETGRAVVRDSAKIRQHPSADGMWIAPLFPFEACFGFEYLELTFEAGYERISAPHEANVSEIISVLDGELEILADGIWHRVHKGQSIRFAGDREHGYRNSGTGPCVVICVIHYPNR